MRGGRRSYTIWAGLAFLVGLALVLQVSGVFRGELEPGDDGHDDALAELESQLFAEMRKEATLRGVPGIEARQRGFGVLTGTVKLHVTGAGPKPMPGVTIHILGHAGESDTESHAEAVTGPDGVFTVPKIAAQVGYVLLVDEPPYRRIVLRGISVRRDQTTNVGTLLLGAPTTLTGEVVDARGRAIAGARVHVLRGSKTSGNFDLRKAVFELQSATSFLAESMASADGKFLLRDLPPGRYVLRVSAPGYATSFKDNVLVTADENSSAVRVVLDAGAGFYGSVLDENGRGIPDARVIALAVPGVQLNRFDRIDVRTDANGAYRMDTLISGMSYAVEGWAQGYAPTGRFPLRASGVTRQDFKLVRSGRIEGRVTDEDSGVGLPDVQVTVLAGKFVGMSPVSTVTDEAGGFVLPHVNPGPVIVFSAKAEGYQPGDKADLKAVNGFKVVAGETTWIDWTLRAGGAVYGRVTTDGGRPVAYASMSLIDRNKGRQRWTGEITAMSDAEGNYELVGVRPGTYDLHVNAAGYAPLSSEESTKVVMGGELGRLPKDVRLARGAVFVGVVTAPDDTPVRGARVWLEGTKRGQAPSGVRDLAAVSGAGGRFRIQGVPPGMHVVVAAEHDSFVAARSSAQRLSAGQEREVAIKLGKGATLSGRAVDSRGNAIADARVRWGNIDGVRERDLRESFTADGYLGARVLSTDIDGRFTITRLPAGKLLVKIEHPDFAAWYRKDLMIAPGEAAQPALTAAMEATLTVSGRVLGGDTGKPLPGAFVYARERGPLEGQEPDPGRVQAVVSVETDATGSYVLRKVPPGTHEIVVWYAEGYIGEGQNHRNPRVRKKGVVAGATGVDFELEPVVPPETEGE